VASINTAVVSPIPASFIDTSERVAKMEKTITITVAAAVTVPAVVLTPWRRRWRCQAPRDGLHGCGSG
jgi:hypothetical protein